MKDEITGGAVEALENPIKTASTLSVLSVLGCNSRPGTPAPKQMHVQKRLAGHGGGVRSLIVYT